jgi:hypothetical protein
VRFHAKNKVFPLSWGGKSARRDFSRRAIHFGLGYASLTLFAYKRATSPVLGVRGIMTMTIVRSLSVAVAAFTSLMVGGQSQAATQQCSRNQDDIKADLVFINNDGEFCPVDVAPNDDLVRPNSNEHGPRITKAPAASQQDQSGGIIIGGSINGGMVQPTAIDPNFPVIPSNDEEHPN